MDSGYLEKRTLQHLQESLGSGGHYLLAVSGGVDSVVMLQLLSRLQRALDWQLTVAHVHHGLSVNPVQQKFREEAQELVGKLAQEKGFEFLTNEKNAENKDTEAAMRNFRYSWFAKWSEQKNTSGVFLAHQNQDWLESQLIQMIRGGSGNAVNSTEKEQNFPRFRPLGNWSKQEVLTYAQENKLTWMEDPSNLENHTLRNWLRNQWLPELESYRAGGLEAFTRSLELLQSQNNNSQDLLKNQKLWLSSSEISRSEFLILSITDQRRVIAVMMNNCGVRNYTQAHIKEVLKRLDTEQKSLSFNTAKVTWSVSPVAFKIHSDTRPDGSLAE